jgi:hypothetical protein
MFFPNSNDEFEGKQYNKIFPTNRQYIILNDTCLYYHFYFQSNPANLQKLMLKSPITAG